MDTEEKTIFTGDKLDALFAMQARLNGFIAASRGLPDPAAPANREVWLQRQLLAMLAEMAEMLGEINFKWWKNPQPVDERALKEEIVDIGHFFLSIALTAGMTAEEFYEIYLDKNDENFRRQFGVSAREGYALADLPKAPPKP